MLYDFFKIKLLSGRYALNSIKKVNNIKKCFLLTPWIKATSSTFSKHIKYQVFNSFTFLFYVSDTLHGDKFINISLSLKLMSTLNVDTLLNIFEVDINK